MDKITYLSGLKNWYFSEFKSFPEVYISKPFLKSDGKLSFGEWKKFSENEFDWGHRSIFPNEIVLETDFPEPKQNIDFYLDKIKPKLTNLNLSYCSFFSGNKSVHVHIFFNKNILPKEREAWVLENFSEEYAFFDKDLIVSSKHLILSEYSENIKTNKVKELLADSSDKFVLNKFNLKEPILIKNKPKVDKSSYEILKNPDATEEERVSCVMKLYNSGYDDEFKILEQIKKVNKWLDFDEAKTLEKINLVLSDYRNKENPLLDKTEVIENQENVSFNDLYLLFNNTHKHLSDFELIENNLGLIGDQYYVLKKFLHYFMHSSLQKPMHVQVGRNYYDNRLHCLLIASSGKGKGVLKNFIKRSRSFSKGSVVEISGTIHPEQLIGKTKYVKKEGQSVPEEIIGYFGSRILIHDEANDIINEATPIHSDIMRIEREAMDCFGFNNTEKKLIDTDLEDMLQYNPDTLFLSLIHPTIFANKFFDKGTFRRYFCFRLESSPIIDISECVLPLFENKSDYSALKSYYSDKHNEYCEKQDIVLINKECLEELSRWILSWNYFCSNNSSPKIRRFGELTFHSIRDYFVKMVLIMNIEHNACYSNINLTKKACFDSVHFLLNTLDNYCKWGSLDKTNDVWRGADNDTILILEYLHRKGATSLEKSEISVIDLQNIICEIKGVNDRQARGLFSKMKSTGYIMSKQVSRHLTKVWLGFLPDISIVTISDLTRHGIEFKKEDGSFFYNFLKEEKKKIYGDLNG